MPFEHGFRLELRSLESNDHSDPAWRAWIPSDPSDACQWFTLDVGVEGEEGSTLFQACVLTPTALKRGKSRRGKFRGFVVQTYESGAVEPLLQAFLDSVSQACWDWEAALETLRERLHWEYEG